MLDWNIFAAQFIPSKTTWNKQVPFICDLVPERQLLLVAGLCAVGGVIVDFS